MEDVYDGNVTTYLLCNGVLVTLSTYIIKKKKQKPFFAICRYYLNAPLSIDQLLVKTQPKTQITINLLFTNLNQIKF